MLEVTPISSLLKFRTPVTLPYWLGSAFRGGVGIQLRESCCVYPQLSCDECSTHCVYYDLYERKRQKKGYAPPPKPIVFVPPFFGRQFMLKEGSTLKLGMLFFGEYVRYLPHIIFALTKLGNKGIGSGRCYGLNQFDVSDIMSYEGESVYKDGVVDMESVKSVEISELEPLDVGGSMLVKFRTPIVIKQGGFPPSLQKLTQMIKQRLILYVNEYGEGRIDSEFECEAEVVLSKPHFHVLRSVSSRSGKRSFYTYTGEVVYRVNTIDEKAKWLLSVGSLIGAGPKSSFGFGFFDITLL